MWLRRLVLGTRRTIAGTVYGTIVVLATLMGGAAGFKDNLWKLAAVAAMTTLVLWVAHVYAHGLGESLSLGRRLTAGELGEVALHELSIPLAAVLPLAAVVLGAVGVLEGRTALWLAFGIGLVTLGGQGVRYARAESLSTTGTVVSVGVNVALGLVIVVMKAVVTH